jgi:hypothetical protein
MSACKIQTKETYEKKANKIHTLTILVFLHTQLHKIILQT